MTRDNLCHAFMVILGVLAAWVAVTDVYGRPYGQPALVSDQAASRLAPTGFDQAQGRGR